jgi:hypothetical protein
MKNLDKYVNDSYRLSLDECFGTWIHNGVWQSVFLFLKIVALRQGCYEATISPVSCSTQPISGQVSKAKGGSNERWTIDVPKELLGLKVGKEIKFI